MIRVVSPIAKDVLSLLGIIIASIIIGFLIQHVPFIISFDNFFYVYINHLPHSSLTKNIVFPFRLWFFPWKIFFMPAYFYIWFVLLLIAVFIKDRSQVLFVTLCLVIGLLLAGILLLIDTHFLFRHRPFDTLPNSVDEISKGILRKFTSYPSGHTRDTAIVATITSYFLPRMKWFMILFVLFIAFTRVYTGEHYPTDVLAGMLFGYLLGNVGISISRLLLKRRNGKENENEKI